MMHDINIVIADDHEIFLDGLSLMLSRQEGFHICARASNGDQLIDVVKKHKPDVVLTDIRMPIKDGIESTKQFLMVLPDTKVIALSMFDEENLIVEMLEAGAKGYLLKNAHKDEIVEAIKSVYKNKNYYCAHTSALLAGMIVRSKFSPVKDEPVALNDRETAIIKMICQQQTAEEIADKIFLSKRTVEGYRTRILEKINAKNTAGVVIYALKNGIITENEIL